MIDERAQTSKGNNFCLRSASKKSLITLTAMLSIDDDGERESVSKALYFVFVTKVVNYSSSWMT